METNQTAPNTSFQSVERKLDPRGLLDFDPFFSTYGISLLSSKFLLVNNLMRIHLSLHGIKTEIYYSGDLTLWDNLHPFSLCWRGSVRVLQQLDLDHFSSIYVGTSFLSTSTLLENNLMGFHLFLYFYYLVKEIDSTPGEKQAWLCGFLQYLNFYGTGVAYVVTTSTCMSAIQKSDCYHKEGHEASCEYEGNLYMFLFGVIQILMSQIPDFHSMVWISVIAAIMSFCYSTIGFGLGVAKVIENGKIYGSITGVPTISAPLKTWLAFQALGDIAFAYPYSIVFLEIQDTVKSPPSENKTMKRASAIAILVTTFFYLGCACTGYAAFGNDTPGNLLTGFGFYEPYWLIDFANACIILHLIGGYQLYSQPVFAYAERWLTGKFPGSGFLNKFYGLKLPFLPDFQLNLFRLSFRTSYVVSTTGIAMAFPYFNEILGLLGGLNLWPLAIYFPVEMYIVQRKIESWSRKWVVLQIFSSLLMVVSAMAFIGSVAGVIEAKMS